MCVFSLPRWDMKEGMIIKKTLEESHKKSLQAQARREITNTLDSCLRKCVREAKQRDRIDTYGF